MIALPNIYLFYERYILKQFRCFKFLKEQIKKSKKKLPFTKKHKYDDLQEVIIPKNVDLDEENINMAEEGKGQGDIVNPSI